MRRPVNLVFDNGHCHATPSTLSSFHLQGTPVGSAELTLVAFGSISMVATAVCLLLKDLVFGQREEKRTLRRRQTVYDRPISQSAMGKIDQGFDRLVIESGVEFSPMTAFMMIVCSALCCGGLAYIYFLDVLIGVGAGLFGMALPLVVLIMKRRKRVAEIRTQLPQVLDMLSRATRAGQSIEQSLELVGEESNGILGAEFEQVSMHLNAGGAFDRAMKVLTSRIPLIEMRILATTLIVQKQAGGRLSETLERMAIVVRDRLSAQRQIAATTGAGRLSSLVVAGIAPFAFFAILSLNPHHLDTLFHDQLGRILFGFAITLEVIGLIWVMLLLKQED